MYPSPEIRQMIIRAFPDFLTLNNLRQQKGLPRLRWCEFMDAKDSGVLASMLEALQKPLDGQISGVISPTCSVPDRSYGPSTALYEPLLLTKDMEVPKEQVLPENDSQEYREVPCCDASGPITINYEV